jgi:hypothetical protein
LKDEFVGHFHCMNITKEQTWARQLNGKRIDLQWDMAMIRTMYGGTETGLF